MNGLVVDLFCGGGGASEGIRQELGRDPDFAVNHDEEAVAMHTRNHAGTRHLHGDVWHYDPQEVVGRAHVELLWASPTCTYFSKAKGGPLDRKLATKVRALAWVVVRWAKEVRPRVIMVENVEAFQQWGPLLDGGQACPRRRGATFRKWVRALEAEGYRVEWRELRACDYGAPTSRKRLFVVARCDGEAIVWPEPTHGRGRLPFRTAAECIDWSIPTPSIFGRKKPLAEATLRRIARGIRKFVIDAAEPFIVPTRHGGDDRVHNIREPIRTVTASNRGELALVSPSLIHLSNGERSGQAPRIYDIQQPLGTVVAGGVKQGLVTAFLAKHFGGHGTPGSPMTRPIDTVTTKDHHALVTSHLVKLYGSCAHGQSVAEPMPTVTAKGSHIGEVRAFLTRYNGIGLGQTLDLPLGTVTTRDRFGLVTVAGEDYEIADIGMRMLAPRELYRAQGFPDTYLIEGFTKTAQIRMAGNSVPPHLSAALVRANLGERESVAA